MCYKSTTKIFWSWYSILLFLCIFSQKHYVHASNEEIKDAIQELKTFFGEQMAHMNSRMNRVDDTLSNIKADLTLLGGTVHSIDSEIMGLGGRSSENHIATKRLTKMQGKLLTEVNNVRENVTEEINNLKNNFESILIDELNSTMFNISTDLEKGHITTQKLNTEVRNLKENITEELTNISNHVESLTIDELKSNIVNISEKMAKDHTTTTKMFSMQEQIFNEFYSIDEKRNASEKTLLNSIELNNKDIKNLKVNVKTMMGTCENNTQLYETQATSLDNIITAIEETQATSLENMNTAFNDIKTSQNSSLELLRKSLGNQYQWHIVGMDRFVRFPKEMNWEDARSLCLGYGMALYKPKNAVAVAKYLEDNFSDRWYWLGARGNGANQAWLSGGVVSRSDPWYSNEYTYVGTSYCLYLITHSGYPAAGTVLATASCTDSTYFDVICG